MGFYKALLKQSQVYIDLSQRWQTFEYFIHLYASKDMHITVLTLFFNN